MITQIDSHLRFQVLKLEEADEQPLIIKSCSSAS
jgi:hypothetical protein